MRTLYVAIWVLLLLVSSVAHAQPIGTSFTYQGELRSSGSPVTGPHDLQFRLYDAASGGTQVGSTLCSDNVAIIEGRFTAVLDFGAQFAGQQRYLEIDVRADTGLNCANPTGYMPLTPRQPVTASPYANFSLSAGEAMTAMTAQNANNAGQLNGQSATFYQNASNLSAGTIPSSRLSGIYSGAIALSNPGNSFTGVGSGLTGLNASNIVTGTLGDGLLAPTYTQALSLTNSSNWFVGVFTGVGAGLTSLNASSIDTGTLSNERLPVPVALDGNVSGASVISATNSSPSGYGLYGFASASGGSSAYAVLGECQGTIGAGVVGSALSTTGNNAGVYGKTASPQGVGVRGYNFALTGNTVGVIGQSVNSPTGTGMVGSGNATGGWFEAFSSTGTGLFGVNSAASGSGVGVKGQTSCDAGVGVYGWASSTTGSTTGGRFETPSTQGIGVFGYTTASSGATKGVYGQSLSSSGTGVLGVATAGTGATYGVFGQTVSDTGHAIHGYAAGGSGGFGIGVWGQTDASAGWAIWSSGRFGASGTKSFCIDHPADPENKYLMHYSAESPEVINFYSGTTRLDDAGEAIVTLPAYFASVNKDPRYTLTAIGAPMPMLHISEEISDDALTAGELAKPGEPVPECWFRIGGGSPGAKVSWEVKAVRNDAFMRIRGAPVETIKPDHARGTFQHPEFYDQPPHRQTGAEHIPRFDPGEGGTAGGGIPR